MPASDDDPDGAVVTFDDVTELVAAQRTSAWADIARRIAHEIKNPLTPIQLSAERLKRRYGDTITGDREVFDKCISTIVRQVGDIGRMVDEFSSFARMPKPEMAMEDLRQVVRESVMLYEVGQTDADVSVKVPETAGSDILRPAAVVAGADQPHQECDRGHPGRGGKQGCAARLSRSGADTAHPWRVGPSASR